MQTCQELCERIDAMLAEDSMPRGPLWRRSVEVLRQLARGHAAMAAKDWRVALDALARADEFALEMKQGRLHIEIFGLRAFALDRCGSARSRCCARRSTWASAYGLLRVFEDAHPDLGEWMSDVLSREPDRATHPVRHAPAPVTQEREGLRPRSTPSTLALTPKEREVLELLARNLSNKEIGLAMQVGEETDSSGT